MGNSRWAAWVWYAIALHWFWGILLLYSPAPRNVTAIASMSRLLFFHMHHIVEGCILLAVATAAAYSLRKHSSFWHIIPQQIVLMLSAYGAVLAIVAGEFADHVQRPRPFIAADQFPAIAAAAFHTLAIIDVYLMKHLEREERKKPGKDMETPSDS